MLLIPAIDLKDGHCVRLEQGDMSVSTSFGDDPAVMARRWLDAGARRLHLVDPERCVRRQAGQRVGGQGHHQGARQRDPHPAGRWHPRSRHHRALPRRRHQLHHHRHRRGQEPGFPQGRLHGLRRPHHRGPGRQGRQGRHRRLEQAHRPRGGRPRAQVPGLRRRGRDLHRHRPRRHAHRHQHRRHRQARPGPHHPRLRLRRPLPASPTSRSCARVEDEGIEGVICGRSIYTGALDFTKAQSRADELFTG